MKFINHATAMLFLLIASAHYLMGQDQSIPADYMKLADDFKKNAQPDSALLYYEKASVEFQKLGRYYRSISEVYYLMGDPVQGDLYKAKSQ